MIDNFTIYKCRLMTLGIQVRLLISWHEDVQQCYEVDVNFHNGLQMKLAISMLRNIIFLHT